MSSRPGRLKQLYYQWRMLKLPWRKKWLIGFDLNGNTYWEFKDQLNAQRLRRIVQYSRKTHFGDVSVSPQWLQWLRHTRFEPPSISEQQYDVSRREQMKVLAAEADARWASTPSRLDAPRRQDKAQGTVTPSALGHADSAARDSPGSGERAATSTPYTGSETLVQGTKPADVQSTPQKAPTEKKNSSRTAPKNPGEDWQPEAWSPGAAKKR